MHPRGITAAIFTDCRPQALAALMRSFRDLDLAEDLYQDACLKAAERWEHDGQPADPLAWLIRVARNAGIDRHRRTRRIAPVSAEDALDAQKPDGHHEAEMAEAIDRAQYRDDVLQLMFMCCHADLRPHEQLALALKVVAGFSLEEIARAFVVTPDTMQRRISRAKRKAAAVAARLEPPSRTERAARLDAVQTMIYLMFNEGYAASGGEDHIRRTLCDEAIRLARLLLRLFPAQGELMGLLALCLLQHARTPARIGPDGRLVMLEDQDRSLWNAIMIAEGRALVEKALRKGKPGPLQVQAAIAAVHCKAARAEDTDWREIDALYAALTLIAPSAIVALNHAVARAKVDGPAAGLAMLDPVAEDLAKYRPYHAVRAGLLEQAGDFSGAIAACGAALALSPTRPEKAYLEDKIATLRALI
ncbi:RNA polymerase sigma factor [Pelagibacterium halotolerans]|uniref:RNA polymerase sigma factor n=1 Tax=Pelagibacterium halotolerans TaxID=531813 RepID=UPI00384E079B